MSTPHPPPDIEDILSLISSPGSRSGGFRGPRRHAMLGGEAVSGGGAARHGTAAWSPDLLSAGTEGVTASFVKEMIRRTVLASLRAGDRPPVLRDARFTAVLAAMNGERQSLTRSLLGVDAGQDTDGRPVRHRRFR